jgi:transposase
MQKICGVDVSKTFLDAGFAGESGSARFANSPDGIEKLLAYCQQRCVSLVAMEATGGHEQQAFELLWAKGLACALCNPRNVRHYAQALGHIEKTDAIDARVIAAFAAAKDLQPTPLPSRKQLNLKALTTRLVQITADISVHKQRRVAASIDAWYIASLDEVIALLNKQARKIEGEIASLIDDDPLWAKLNTAFRSLKGVAGRTVAKLLALLPEIGLYDNKAIAKLAGLAPLANDSGQTNRPRHIRGGRADIRSALFLIARGVGLYNKTLAAFRDKLIAAGKPKMVVRIAMARKLLIWLNAKARDARKEFANAT